MTSSQQTSWLPLADAAEKISSTTGKPCSKADVLRAGLYGMLKMSVQVVTPVFARPGHFQECSGDAPYGVSTNVQQAVAADGVPRPGLWLYDALGIQGVFAYASTGGDNIKGLLDLVLIGNGKTHIENLERQDDGDCQDVKHLPSGGIYLQGATGLVWELQDEILSGEHQDPKREPEYAPAERFPADWRIVVRTSEVERFLQEQQQELIDEHNRLSEHQPTEENLIPVTLLQRYDIPKPEALRLGIEGKLRFFTYVKYATIVFGDVVEASGGEKEGLDPHYCLDVDKGFYFQVSPETLREMLQTPDEKTKHLVQLVFPDALKGMSGDWDPHGNDAKYKTRIDANLSCCDHGFYKTLKPAAENWTENDHLEEQRWRTFENLCILKEDLAAYKRGLNSNDQPAQEQERADIGDLITLTAASKMTGKPKEVLLEDAANGAMEIFTNFLTAKVEHGKFPIQPAQSNDALDWPAGEHRPYATALHPSVAEDAAASLQKIDVKGYEYPKTPLKLDAVHIDMIRQGRPATIEYGFLANGRAFQVVDPIGGLTVTIDDLFVRQNDLLHLQKQQPATSNDGHEKVATVTGVEKQIPKMNERPVDFVSRLRSEEGLTDDVEITKRLLSVYPNASPKTVGMAVNPPKPEENLGEDAARGRGRSLIKKARKTQ